MGPDKSKIAALEKRMKQLGINRKDIEEKFIKSSGRGGQKVNKSMSAVFLRHLPTGITVKCGKSRSQHLNRFLAMRLLVDRLAAEKGNQMQEDEKRLQKIRKQKSRRKRRAKKKITDE